MKKYKYLIIDNNKKLHAGEAFFEKVKIVINGEEIDHNYYAMIDVVDFDFNYMYFEKTSLMGKWYMIPAIVDVK